MKIRNGFVSNSSSSSFIVLFPREPKSMEDVKVVLFRKGETIFANPYDTGCWSVETVAQTVWKNICDQKKNDFDKAEEILDSGVIDDENAPDWEDYNHITDWVTKRDTFMTAQNKYAKEKMKEFFNLRKLKLKKINNEPIEDGVFYCFEYFSSLEHGDLFKNLKHITVSNH